MRDIEHAPPPWCPPSWLIEAQSRITPSDPDVRLTHPNADLSTDAYCDECLEQWRVRLWKFQFEARASQLCDECIAEKTRRVRQAITAWLDAEHERIVSDAATRTKLAANAARRGVRQRASLVSEGGPR